MLYLSRRDIYAEFIPKQVGANPDQKSHYYHCINHYPLMIGVAIMFSGNPVFKETIAFVTELDEVHHLPSDSAFRVVTVHQKPKFSDLMLGKYAAIVEKNQLDYKVTTLKSKADQKMIQQFFETGEMPGSYRGEDKLRTDGERERIY